MASNLSDKCREAPSEGKLTFGVGSIIAALMTTNLGVLDDSPVARVKRERETERTVRAVVGDIPAE